MKPEFIVQLVSDYNGNGQRLQWGYVPLPSPHHLQDYKFYGRYACFPLKIHNGGKLLKEEEPTVTVPRKLIEQVLETFRSGVIADETREGLHKALKQKIKLSPF